MTRKEIIGVYTNGSAYSASIPFTSPLKIMSHTIAGAITLTPDSTGAVAGCGTLLRLISNGVDEPDTTAFKKISGSSNYANTNGLINNLFFFFDGTDYWVNVWFDAGVAPVLLTAVIEDTDHSKVILTYNKALSPDYIPLVAAYTIAGKTISSVSVIGATVLVTVSVPFIFGDTPLITYDTTVNRIRDTEGNLAALFEDEIIDNQIIEEAGFVDIIWDQLNNGATYDGTDIEIDSNGNVNSGGFRTGVLAMADGFELIHKMTKSKSNASTLCIDLSLDTNYSWPGGGQDFIVGTNVQGDQVYACGVVAGSVSNFANVEVIGAIVYSKIIRSGNDAVFQYSADDVTYTTFHTRTDAFLGVTNGYLKAVFPVAGAYSVKGQYKL